MRPDLEEWANAKGIKPAFLFPELYAAQSREPLVFNKVSPKEFETYQDESVISTRSADYEHPASINKTENQESSEDSFSKDECLLFDPLTKKQIEQLFTTVPGKDWIKFFDKALRNGLASARHGKKPYKYNPARVANWLYCKGKYRQDALARILSKNFPARSWQHRDSFLEWRGLLDED